MTIRERKRPFDQQTEDLARFARAMAHPARVGIVRMLIQNGGMCCGELVERLPIAQASVSQHLRALERVRLLTAQKQGVRIVYGIQRERLREFCHAFQKSLKADEPATTSRTRWSNAHHMTTQPPTATTSRTRGTNPCFL